MTQGSSEENGIIIPDGTEYTFYCISYYSSVLLNAERYEKWKEME
jgi:hypothetical protein